MKVGILGGTFNPVHLGHLILAEEARELLSLDKVVFVPTYLPPHKTSRGIAPVEARLTMIQLAIKGNKYFSVSDMEIRRGGKSYTIDTVKEFKKEFAFGGLFFIIGSDLVGYLDAWKDFNEITKLVKIIVATRPGYPLEDISARMATRHTGVTTMPIRALDISAFEIRSCIRQNSSFRYFVPERVFRYINKERLYL